MNTPEESQAEDRRRRTERQREKRERERVCGYCRKPATAGLIEWFGRARPLANSHLPRLPGKAGGLLA